jgi:hypothetical protein
MKLFTGLKMKLKAEVEPTVFRTWGRVVQRLFVLYGIENMNMFGGNF